MQCHIHIAEYLQETSPNELMISLHNVQGVRFFELSYFCRMYLSIENSAIITIENPATFVNSNQYQFLIKLAGFSIIILFELYMLYEFSYC